MYEVKENIIEANSKAGWKHLIPVFRREVMDGFSTYEVAAGTDGTIDGDDDDSRTYINICNAIGSGLFKVHNDTDGDGCGVTITAVGDDELRALIKTLKFVTKVLEEEAHEIDD